MPNICGTNSARAPSAWSTLALDKDLMGGAEDGVTTSEVADEALLQDAPSDQACDLDSLLEAGHGGNDDEQCAPFCFRGSWLW